MMDHVPNGKPNLRIIGQQISDFILRSSAASRIPAPEKRRYSGVKPTTYKGVNFRSRTEARWAVYFDAMSLPWCYELEQFNFANGIDYLPDFWLPTLGWRAEVKPDAFTDTEIEKLIWLAYVTGNPAVALVDSPEWKPYQQFVWVPGDPPTIKEYGVCVCNQEMGLVEETQAVFAAANVAKKHCF